MHVYFNDTITGSLNTGRKIRILHHFMNYGMHHTTGVQFIINTESKPALYSNARDKLGLNHIDISIPYRGQYWYIRLGQDENGGLYLLVSDYNDRGIYVDCDKDLQWGRAGTSAPAGCSVFQYFDLSQQQSKDVRAGQFRIYNPTNDGGSFLTNNSRTRDWVCLRCH